MDQSSATIFTAVTTGIQDALRMDVSLSCLLGSKAVRDAYWTCFLLNGILFLGSVTFFTSVAKPFIMDILFLSSWAEPAICGPWNSQFVLPMYFLSLILNVSLFQSIADAGNACLLDPKSKKSAGGAPSMAISTTVATMAFSIIMQQIMLIQAALVGSIGDFVPVNPVTRFALEGLQFAITAWMASFYCFEYSWIRRGWDFQRRVTYFEQRWAYFFGFGVPITLCTMYFNAVVNAAMFAIIFPSLLLNSNATKPIQSDYQLPICFVAKRLTNSSVVLLKEYIPKLLQLSASTIAIILLITLGAATFVAWSGGC